MMKVDHDLHVHTYLSSCCNDKTNQIPRSILALAEDMDVTTIGFADHVWNNPLIPPSDWYRPQGEAQILRLRHDLAEIPTSVGVLVGCEADMIAPGRFGITRKFARELDYVLLACSHFHMREFVEQPTTASPRDIGRHLLKFFISGVSSGLATSIAHPFLPCGYMDQFDRIIAAISDAEFADAFGVAAEQDVGIEITTGFLSPNAGIPFSIETPTRFLSIAKQVGCKFSFGSDAHNSAQQRRLPELARFVQTLGLTVNDLLPVLQHGAKVLRSGCEGS